MKRTWKVIIGGATADALVLTPDNRLLHTLRISPMVVYVSTTTNDEVRKLGELVILNSDIEIIEVTGTAWSI